jgi:predicted RNase H-like nuclease (RuvC/YqgF family)
VSIDEKIALHIKKLEERIAELEDENIRLEDQNDDLQRELKPIRELRDISDNQYWVDGFEKGCEINFSDPATIKALPKELIDIALMVIGQGACDDDA